MGDLPTQWRLFVGIDFGTDGSGISYTIPNGATYIHNKWDSNDATVKSKTNVLLTDQNEVEVVGSKAEDTWAISQTPKKLFKTFKMALYDEEELLSDAQRRRAIRKSNTKSNKVRQLKDKIEATNDPTITVNSEIVFVAGLQYLRNQAFGFISEYLVNKCNLIGNSEEGWTNVQYYVTVPAIWGEKAKHQMRGWAIKAKLITGNIKYQLKIVYEPDCASLSLQYAMFQNDDSNLTDFDMDTKYENKTDDKRDDSFTIKKILEKIGLLQYYKMFMQQDCISITEIKELSIEHLKQHLGIRKLSHRIKIHDVFQKYSNNNGIQKLHPRIDVDVKLSKGDKYILIDTGGGTCDFACHKFESKYVVSELYHPSGGSWGSNNINKLFTYYIDEIFGIENSTLHNIRDSQGRIGYLDLLRNFENAKKEFGENYDACSSKYFDVELPIRLVNYLSKEWAKSYNKSFDPKLDSEHEYCSIDCIAYKRKNTTNTFQQREAKKIDILAENTAQLMQEKLQHRDIWETRYKSELKKELEIKKLIDVNKITSFEDTSVVYSKLETVSINGDTKYYLSLHRNVWFIMLNETIQPIVTHCDVLLKEEELENVKYIFLVGGFAESKYFQNYFKGYFKQFEVVIPNLPGLCVVDGASKYGLDPHLVRVRKMSKHYGIGVNRLKSYVSSKVSQEYVDQHTIMRDNTHYVNGIFKRFVNKNEPVRFNDKPRIHSLSKWDKNSTKVIISIYSSNQDNPHTTSECHKIGELLIPIARNKQMMMIEFIFSETIFTVYAYEKGKRQNKKEIAIYYETGNFES